MISKLDDYQINTVLLGNAKRRMALLAGAHAAAERTNRHFCLFANYFCSTLP